MKKKEFSMKNKIKWFGFISLVAIIWVLVAACSIIPNPDDDDDSGTPTNYSLDGIWEDITSKQQITVSGSTGTLSSAGSSIIVRQMVDKNLLPIGGVTWRNISKTGNLTWSGEHLQPTGTTNPLNVTGARWESLSITMSADGQTINHGSTWKRVSGYSLDGTWEDNNSKQQITVSGSTGTLISAGSSVIVQQMVDKNLLPIGGVTWRNISKTGNLTWSGEHLQPTGTTNPLNVTGVRWASLSITMSADGKTIDHGSVWTRKY